MEEQKTIEGLHYRTQRPIRINLDQGVIRSIEELKECFTPYILAPGLVDLQVNGFQGVDFNEPELEVSDVVFSVQKLWENGMTTFMPTLITASESAVSESIKIIIEACKDTLINATVTGIHLEGPFISRETGPRGAHPLEFVCEPDWDMVVRLQEVAKGKIKLITLSPEYEGAPELIEKCVGQGIQVAIGHTAAHSAQIKHAVEVGASLSTHLGNAAHLLLPRHPNYIWDQLAMDSLWTSIVSDGFHLPDPVMKVFMKTKPENTFLVSDSTKFAGLPAGTYQSPIGGTVLLTKEGRLCMQENPELLAGSAASLKSCLEYLVKANLATWSQAIDMASVKPLSYLTQKSSSIGLQAGNNADLILFEHKDSKMEIKKTLKAGKLVYSSL
ncbi:amidohydrolase family protein [Algoriphagus sp. AGSA1]|uniref:N-acetylglucosamine-6-phosphate deacetylase n=1 Tax=Algoriphagus sp. AGSA1 TaxID=2907213 RepID=UPI001F219851|nr:amidohydrolase family protein [Algoriphagus sp. AGSA1]MCE7055002.1 amidohydrolase family protein [Algoriphagus sp. AGSA1]